MKDARSIILHKIREGLKNPVTKPFPDVVPENVFTQSEETLAVRFAEEFVKVDGHFFYCENATDLAKAILNLSNKNDWKYLYCWDKDLQAFFNKFDFRACRIGKKLDKAEGGITSCEALIARTGSILVSSRQAGGRTLSAYPPIHIVIATVDQIVADIQDGIDLINKNYPKLIPSQISLITGPSRTADIEKTLVKGIHGPKEVYLFLVGG